MFRERNLVLLLATVCVLGTGASHADAHQPARGIFFRLGETLVTELTPAGDTDTFVFYGVRGAEISVTLEAETAGFSPTMVLLDAERNVLDTSARTRVKGSKVRLRKVPLPATGAYFIRVTESHGRTGRFRLETKGNLRRVPGRHRVTLDPGETHDIRFGAGTGLEVLVKLKPDDREKSLSVLSVYDPDGEEMPHGVGGFVRTGRGWRAALLMRSSARSSWCDAGGRRRLGDYGIRIGGTTTTTTVEVKVKVRHPKGKGTRIIASTVPTVSSAEPTFGRPGTLVVVHGSDFLPGEARVLFGEALGRGPTVVSSTRIEVTAPYGEGEVDLTVINPDGQEGVLEDGFTFIALPPTILSVTPSQGPDSGGTVVSVCGESLRFVEKLTLGGVEPAGPITIVSESEIRFTTEAGVPGVHDLVLTDRFGQICTREEAFTLLAAPTLMTVEPARASFAGGHVITSIGMDFTPDTELLVNGVPVPTTFVSGTILRFTTAPGTRGDGLDIGVRDPWGRTHTIPHAFEYTDGQFDDITTGLMPTNSESLFSGGTTLVLGDIDGDDDLDVAIGHSVPSDGKGHKTFLLKNNTPGTPGVSYLPSPPVWVAPWYYKTYIFNYGGGKSYATAADEWQASALVLGDVDDDDDLDIVLTSDEDIHFRRATYIWKWNPSPYYYFWTYRYTAKQIPKSSTRVLLNDGTGHFKVSLSALPDPRTTAGTTDTLRGNALALGDIDDDGDQDLIVSSETAVRQTSYTYRYIRNPLAYFGYGISYSYYFNWFWSDGIGRSATRVLLNDGTGTFTDATSTHMPAVGGDLFAAQASALVDADGDGDLDLVLTGDHPGLRDPDQATFIKGSKTRVLLNDGGGKFTDATSTWVPAVKTGEDWGAETIAADDIDGDGKPDLVFSTGRAVQASDESHLSSTRVFRNTGSKFTEATETALPAVRADGKGEMWRGVHVMLAQANSDPGLDIVIVDVRIILVEDPVTGLYTVPVSSTRVLRNDGTGAFTDDTRNVMPRTGTDWWRGSAVTLGDMDDDGDNDLLITTDVNPYGAPGVAATRLLEWR